MEREGKGRVERKARGVERGGKGGMKRGGVGRGWRQREERERQEERSGK